MPGQLRFINSPGIISGQNCTIQDAVSPEQVRSRNPVPAMVGGGVEEVEVPMRRRLRKFFPIVLIALMVQIFAPIGACFAASIAAADPLHAAVICSGGTASNETNRGGEHRAHDGSCSACFAAQAAASLDSPQAIFAPPQRQSARVAWRDAAPDLTGSRTWSHAQARAPPSIS